MFSSAVHKEDMKAVFLEYAWNMGWCDPCAADPLSPKQLRELGAYWIDEPQPNDSLSPTPRPRRPRNTLARNAYVTRLHVRYTGETFPDDLRFQETGNTQNFQARYVLRHPYTGNAQCDALENYKRRVIERREKERVTLAGLTGWDMTQIRAKSGLSLRRQPTRSNR